MTEKRFQKVKVYLSYEILDVQDNQQLDVDSVVDLLNELAEENEQLKQANERICDDIDLALGFIQHKGYSLQDIKDYEDAKKEYEEDLKEFRKGDVE